MTCPDCGLAFDEVIVVQCDPTNPDSVCEPWVADKPNFCDCGEAATFNMRHVCPDWDNPHLCVDCHRIHREERVRKYHQEQAAFHKMISDWVASCGGGEE